MLNRYMVENQTYSVLIPAFNAEKTIDKLLMELNELPEKPAGIIVVDDGSQDSTAKLAANRGAIVECIATNSGKGFALKKGFEIFISKLNSEYLICMDADLQHPVSSIEDFLNKSKYSDQSLLIGKRNISIKNMPLLRYLSNKVTSYILSILSGKKIADSQCGFRLIPRSLLHNLKCHENGFQLESEFILRCAEQNIPLDFVDIPTIYNKNGSNINHFSDTFKFVKLVLKEIVKR